MYIFRTLCLALLVVFGLGCSSSREAQGIYVFASDSSFQGSYSLHGDGTFRAKVGKARVAGTWNQANGQVFVAAEGDMGRLIPNQYRIDGEKLIAQFEGVDAKQWRLQKQGSQSVANRLD
jgi:hypothetical protein